MWLSSAKSYAESSEFQYRIVPVVFGAGMILLLWLVADGMSPVTMFITGMLTAISPAMTYYSRYYIQEMLLVFFSFALIGCGWRWMQSKKSKWAVAAGVCAGLMHATKETCVIVFFSIGAGLTALWIFRGEDFSGETPEAKVKSRRTILNHSAIAVMAAGAISILFYSSFFTNARGPLDSVLAYGNYFERSASPNLHDKPWYYYLQLLIWNNKPGAPIWTEALIVVLAVAGATIAFLPPLENSQRIFIRFIAVYTLVMTLVYSLIAYKTPWCVLGILHGMILLAV